MASRLGSRRSMAAQAIVAGLVLALSSEPCLGFLTSPLSARLPGTSVLGRSALSARVPSLRANVGALRMQDYPKPNVENTDNYRIANELSSKFTQVKGKAEKKK
eukprot:2082765-Rhodomonas_salina.1